MTYHRFECTVIPLWAVTQLLIVILLATVGLPAWRLYIAAAVTWIATVVTLAENTPVQEER